MFSEAKFQYRYRCTVIEFINQHVLSSTFYLTTSNYNHFSKTTQRTFSRQKSIIKAIENGENLTQIYE